MEKRFANGECARVCLAPKYCSFGGAKNAKNIRFSQDSQPAQALPGFLITAQTNKQTQLACVPDVLGELAQEVVAVWRHNNKQKTKTR